MTRELAELLASKHAAIVSLVEHAEELAPIVRATSPAVVPCHGDLHAGNVLIERNGTPTIVDWDHPVLAPKERDLMFIGGGVGGVWNKPEESAAFYRGYGHATVDVAALAYYRCERIVEDIATYSDQLLHHVGRGTDRPRALRKLRDAFGANDVVEIAEQTFAELVGDSHLVDCSHMPGKAKPTAKRASPASGARKPAAKAKKTANAGTKAKSPPKAGAKAKPGASEAKPMTGKAASRLIDQRIRDLGGWRGETLARMRALILEADPEMTEDCKWIKPTNPLGVPVWSHAGIVCTGEAYTKVVKLTFARGARVPDPSRLFNSSLGGNTRRAIDIHEGEKVDARAFKALVQAAVAQNGPPAKKR